MKLNQLTEAIAQENMNCGEIITPESFARLVQEFENDNGVAFTGEEILKAFRDAGDLFVDSMQGNEHDTEEEVHDGMRNGWPIEPLAERLARWEVMRPSVIRRKFIAAAIVSPAPQPVTINEWTLEAFTSYLEESLIPDLKESDMDATAEDFQTALDFIFLLSK